MSEANLGEIRIFAGNYAPEGWLLCDGSLIQVSQYNALFSLLGKTYGGDGVTTFALPDLRGRVPVHVGQGKTLQTNWTPGMKTGTETVVITDDQLPAHNHTFFASTANATASAPSPTLMLGAVQPSAGTARALYLSPAAPGSARQFDTLVLSPEGQNGAHSNVMPFIVLSYIICMAGTYPQPAQ